MNSDNLDLFLMETLMPKFPRTKHLPLNPNATSDDKIASEEECDILFKSDNVFYEDKLDGANTAIYFDSYGNPIIRNRNHILNKGYGKKETPAKLQYRPIWNWAYEHLDNFKRLREKLDFEPAVYGEWLYARHTINYDLLPSYFIAFDIYDGKNFLDSRTARQYLQNSGFDLPPLLREGKIKSFNELEALMERKSSFSSSDTIEGLYIKAFDGEKVTHRFKMVRQGFIQGEHWNKSALNRNLLRKGR